MSNPHDAGDDMLPCDIADGGHQCNAWLRPFKCSGTAALLSPHAARRPVLRGHEPGSSAPVSAAGTAATDCGGGRPLRSASSACMRAYAASLVSASAGDAAADVPASSPWSPSGCCPAAPSLRLSVPAGSSGGSGASSGVCEQARRQDGSFELAGVGQVPGTKHVVLRVQLKGLTNDITGERLLRQSEVGIEHS